MSPGMRAELPPRVKQLSSPRQPMEALQEGGQHGGLRSPKTRRFGPPQPKANRTMKTSCVVVALLLAASQLTGGEPLLDSSPAGFRDGGFEACAPNGTPPDSGAWKFEWLGEAGGVVTTTASRSGKAGLWAFTGRAAAHRWSAIGQEIRASAGAVYQAAGWVRTPADEPWVPGSKAMIQVRFLDASGSELVRISAEPLTGRGTEWQRQALVTCPAPEGTTRVRLVCYLEKPLDESGLSVANFDDLYLGEKPASKSPASQVGER